MHRYWIRLDRGGSSERGGCNRAIAVLPISAMKDSKIHTSVNFVYEMIKALLVVEHRNLRKDLEWQLRQDHNLSLRISDYETLLPRSIASQSRSNQLWRVESLPNPSDEVIFRVGCRTQNIHIRQMGDIHVFEWMYPILPVIDILKQPEGAELLGEIAKLSKVESLELCSRMN